jgi:hypothetical protein
MRREFFAGGAGSCGHFASGAQSCYGVAGGHEFHGCVALIIELAEFAENGFIVNFAGAGLVAAGNIGNVNEADEIDIFFELGDQISFGDLFVEEIVKESYVGIVDGADNFEAFGGGEKYFGFSSGSIFSMRS